MEAKVSLSPEQQHTLESVYTFIKGAVIHPRAYSFVYSGADEKQVLSLIERGLSCQSGLLGQFPELREWVFRRGDAQ